MSAIFINNFCIFSYLGHAAVCVDGARARAIAYKFVYAAFQSA